MVSSLKGKWIVVTRPSHQSKGFIKKLEEKGANVISFPLLEIHPATDKKLVKRQLEQAHKYQLIIFVSANAVEQCFKLVPVDRFSSLALATVGKKTAQQLTNHGLSVCCMPKRPFNSEALLELPELKKLGENDKVAIIRGEGGRELLKKSLQAQGAHVDYIDVYRRSCPQRNLGGLTKHYHQNQLDIILFTSVQSVSNLFDLQEHEDDNSWLNQVEVMAGSSRIEQHIVSSTPHIGKVHTTTDPSDETLYNQLVIWGDVQGNKNAS